MENGGILSASAPIELDGRELQLRYRAFAFIRYAEECGGDLLREISTLGEQLQALAAPGASMGNSWVKLRDILWAGLIDAQPDITREDVSRMFGLSDLAVIAPAITQAIQRTMPQTPEEKPARPTKARRAITDSGRVSGPIIEHETASPPPNSGV